MAHVPDKAILGRVEDIVESNGQIDGTQAGSEVAAVRRHGVHEIGAQFTGKPFQPGGGQAA